MIAWNDKMLINNAADQQLLIADVLLIWLIFSVSITF